jgi:hypothetical protein
MAAQHLKAAHETGIKIDSGRIERLRRLHAAAYNRSFQRPDQPCRHEPDWRRGNSGQSVMFTDQMLGKGPLHPPPHGQPRRD